MKENVTVAHLVVTLDRIEQWLQALRKGLEALPQDQEIELSLDGLEEDLNSRQPWFVTGC